MSLRVLILHRREEKKEKQKKEGETSLKGREWKTCIKYN